MKKIKLNIGDRIRFIRQHVLGCTGKQLAQMAGCGQVAISYWESGKRDVPVSFLYFLANRFLISLNYLILGQGPVFSMYPKSTYPVVDQVDVSKCDPHFLRSELTHHARYARKVYCVTLPDNSISSMTFYPQRKMFLLGDNNYLDMNFLLEMQKSSGNEIEITVLSSESDNVGNDVTLDDLEKMEGNDFDFDKFEEEEENENLIVQKIEEIKNYLIRMPELVDNIHNLLAIVSQKK